MGRRQLLFRRALFFVCLLLFSSVSSPHAADVFIFTENYPPYNFPAADGTVAGDATALVRKVMNTSELDYSITIVPWARAVRYTETADNVLIYSIARIPNREERFQWLVPLAFDNYRLFARKDDKRVFTREQLRKGAFSVICVQGDISCTILQDTGLPEASIIQSPDLDQPGTLKMVEAGRVDLFPGSMINYQTERQHHGAWRGAFKPVYDLEVGLTLYLAGGANLRPELAAKIRAAYAHLVDANDFDMMFVDGPPIDR
ncbi:substrate-binding periplasmic protein [Kordiimonas lacus]|uniref:substrate-binding periplasmic protein n=1 Tax=Kordiimonas lacus TaxID=637679 RepID=UPI0009E745BE|nr:transporter substrate-binding domain-containing protein [Kordiimonas lacus]